MKSSKAPAWQYTARCSSTGTTFLGYADSRSLDYSVYFIQTILSHLDKSGIDLTEVRIQTDNGSEFIGSVMAKNPSAFTNVIENDYMATHKTIPPKRHTWQADVETFHNTIEPEFLEIESFKNINEFRSKINTYLLYYNTKRQISTKEYKTPLQLLVEKNVSPQAVMLPPIFLQELLPQSKGLPFYKKGVYHVGSLPCNICFCMLEIMGVIGFFNITDHSASR